MSRTGWGIEPSYRDAFGRRHQVSETVLRRIREAMGSAPTDDGGVDPVAIVRAGGRLPIPGEVTLEDGTPLGRLAELPRDVPIGYHRLVDDRGSRLLIVGPGRCHLPPGLRDWGWAVQLYAARSTRSWGIGDLADLRQLAEWSADLGAGLMVVNPLHAPAPTLPIQPSPYFPSTRRFHDPLYQRVEEVPGVPDPGGQRSRFDLTLTIAVLEIRPHLFS